MNKYVANLLFSLTISLIGFSGLSAANAGVLICSKKNGKLVVLVGSSRDSKAQGNYTASDFGGLREKGEFPKRNAAREMCEESLFVIPRKFDKSNSLNYSKLYGKNKDKNVINKAISIVESKLNKRVKIMDFKNNTKPFYRMYFLSMNFFRAKELRDALKNLTNRFKKLPGAECKYFDWIDPFSAKMVNGIPMATYAFPDKNGKFNTIRLRRCFYYALINKDSQKILKSL